MIILFSNSTETNEDCIACGLYAHGELETMLGHDVVCPRYDPISENLRDIWEDGIYDVVIQHGDERIPAKLYYWRTGDWHRGLAVLATDLESVKFAEDNYNERSRFL